MYFLHVVPLFYLSQLNESQSTFQMRLKTNLNILKILLKGIFMLFFNVRFGQSWEFHQMLTGALSFTSQTTVRVDAGSIMQQVP